MARSEKHANDTIDVLNKGCFNFYDTIACGRISLLVFISALTFLFTVLKIIKYHMHKHAQIHHYIIFYISAVQCIICIACFLFGVQYPQLEFMINFIKLFQFTLICHLHWSMTARSCHREDVVQHVINPVTFLYTLYCITVALMGMVDISGTWTECFRPYWLMLTSADFIAVQIFAIVALCLIHGNNHLNVSKLILPITTYARELRLVTAVYEVSAVISVVFDAVMAFMGKPESGCSGIYNHTQLYYSFFIIGVIILKYFVPMWTLLCVFQPNQVKSRPSEVTLTSHYNMDGTCYNQYHPIFFSHDLRLSSSLPYPNGLYSVESPILGSLGDFSYTDSSSESSPVIVRYWAGMKDNHHDDYNDKELIDNGLIKVENDLRIEQNRQCFEKCLEFNSGIYKTNPSNNKNLTTINEENFHDVEGKQESPETK